MRTSLPGVLLFVLSACGSDSDSKPIGTADARIMIDARAADAAVALPDAPALPDARLIPDAAPAIDGTGGNSVPTIGLEGTATTAEDTAVTIHLDVGDADGSAAALVVTAVATDTTLFPSGSVVVGGSGTGRTVALTPAPGRSGATTVTISVSDGIDTARTTVNVSVSPVNDPPTIAAITDKTVTEDGTLGPITLLIADEDSASSEITVTATSDDEELLSDVVVGGSGLSRTLTIEPGANASGTSHVTVTVMDGGGGSRSVTFQVTVTAVDDAPTIAAVGGVTTAMNSSYGPLTLVIADVDTAAGALVVTASADNATLLPAGGISVGGGPPYTLTLTPAADKTGTTKVTITVMDGSSTVTTELTLSVTSPDNDPPTIAAIAAQMMEEDGDLPIVLEVDDDRTATNQLVITASAEDTTLFPSPAISVTGPMLLLQPASDRSGTTEITVVVADDEGAMSSTKFTVTVTAVNDKPTIAAVADQNTLEDMAVEDLAIAIGDLETSAGSLSLQAESDNDEVVALAGIAFGGSDGARTVTITPVEDASGEANITVTVSDGGEMAEVTFKVTVSAVNDPPEPTAVPTVEVYAGDTVNIILEGTDAEGSSLMAMVTSVPDEGSFLTDTSGSAPLTVTYKAELEPSSGMDSFSFEISDGDETAQGNVNITILYCGDGVLNGDEVCDGDMGEIPPGADCSPTSCKPLADCDDNPETGDDGLETDLSSDDDNCGSCDHDCEIATCESGKCHYEPACGLTYLSQGTYSFDSVNIRACVTHLFVSTGVLDWTVTGDVTIAGTLNLSGGNGATPGSMNNGVVYKLPTGGWTGYPEHGSFVNGYSAGAGGMGGIFSASEYGSPGPGSVNEGTGGKWGGGASSLYGSGGGGGHAGGAGGGSDGNFGGIGGGTDHGTGGYSATGGQCAVNAYDGGNGGGFSFFAGGGGGGGSIGTAAAQNLDVSSTFYAGSGGGGGGIRHNSVPGGGTPGSGGGGGGAVRIVAGGTLTVSGVITAHGGNGGNGTDPSGAMLGGGGGGGGSGGVIVLMSEDLAISGYLDVRPGAGGAMGGFNSGPGGAGGPGRIRLKVGASCSITHPNFIAIKGGDDPFVDSQSPCDDANQVTKVYVDHYQ